MEETLTHLINGYQQFKEKYLTEHPELMRQLAEKQTPKTMVIACSDSRVDPALILQCDPGDLFTVRNVANIIPPYEGDHVWHHGTSAALEFGICYLNISRLVVLGHSRCGGIHTYLEHNTLHQDDFISNWLDLLNDTHYHPDPDTFSKNALLSSYHNLLSFPWIQERVKLGTLQISLWFFEIESVTLYDYHFIKKQFIEFGKDA